MMTRPAVPCLHFPTPASGAVRSGGRHPPARLPRHQTYYYYYYYYVVCS